MFYIPVSFFFFLLKQRKSVTVFRLLLILLFINCKNYSIFRNIEVQTIYPAQKKSIKILSYANNSVFV